MKHFKILITILILIQAYSLNCQNIHKLDSIEISKITLGFFDWYLNAIKGKHRAEFQPGFVKSKNGMTTLDFTKYFENLKRFSFSDSLIMKVKFSYQECLNNLDTIKYSDFKTKIISLSDYKCIRCDFDNCYSWIGGQKICDGLQISAIFFGKDGCFVTMEKYVFNNEKKKDIYGEIDIILIKQNNAWFINDIKNPVRI